MEKNELGSIIIYLIMFGLIYLVGQTVIVLALKSTAVQNQALYIFICAVVSILVFAFTYELGHVIGAKIGKYKCTYFNVFGFCWYKEDEKWKFKFEGFDGLFGETRFVPISKDAKCNPAHFLRGGLIAFIVSVLVALVIFIITAIPDTIRFGTLIYFGVGMVFVLYNVIPMKTDILNDGYRLKLLGSKENAEAYNEFMRIENDARKGIVTEDVKVYENISPMTVLINNYAFYNALAKHDYQKAEEIVDIILKDPNALDSNTVYRFRFQKLYFVILRENKEEASEYYWKTMTSYDRKYLVKDNFIPSKRVYLLVSGIINESSSESVIAIEGVKKRINRMVNKTQQSVEMEQYEKCIKLVSENLKVDDLSEHF